MIISEYLKVTVAYKTEEFKIFPNVNIMNYIIYKNDKNENKSQIRLNLIELLSLFLV